MTPLTSRMKETSWRKHELRKRAPCPQGQMGDPARKHFASPGSARREGGLISLGVHRTVNANAFGHASAMILRMCQECVAGAGHTFSGPKDRAAASSTLLSMSSNT